MQETLTVQPAAMPTERRARSDRRAAPTKMLGRYTFFGGRRERGRRSMERQNIFVDRFGQGVFFFVTLILLLNMLDAYFTMFFLGVGGQEVNPVAFALLRIGPWAFLVAKTVGIGLCAAYLVLVKKFRGVSLGIGIVLAIYVVLICWHFYLYSFCIAFCYAWIL